MSKYFAFGIRYSDEGWCLSAGIAEDIAGNPQLLANALYNEFGTVFEEIVLMQNGADGPIFFANYVLDKDFVEESADMAAD